MLAFRLMVKAIASNIGILSSIYRLETSVIRVVKLYNPFTHQVTSLLAFWATVMAKSKARTSSATEREKYKHSINRCTGISASS